MPNASSYNIVGEIPGENSDRMILLSGHYDSYFSGFQDDNTAVSMMIEIGRMLIKSNYKPKNTNNIMRHGSGGMGSHQFQVRLVYGSL